MKKNLLASGLMLFAATVLAQTPRLVLYEEFTGETCPPCASTNPGLNVKLTTYSNICVPIKWQVPIPSAPSNTWSLYQTNKTEIDWRWRSTANGGYGYSPAINSAPSSKIDGQEATVFGASSGHPANLTGTVLQTAQSYTSAFSITLQRDWNYNCSAVTVTVNITATAPFTVSSPGKLKFRLVMVERLIQFSVQPGTNGEKDFEWAAIKSFPTLQQGTAMADSWTNNQSMTFTVNCPLPSYVRKKSEIAFVGFIQDDGNQRVAQAVRSMPAAMPADGVAALAANVGVTCSNQITPKITVNNTGTGSPITTMTVVPFIDNVAGSPINWTGNIPVGSTSVISLGGVTTPTVAGQHTFSYNITSLGAPQYNISGNSSKVNFLVAGAPDANPVAEGFVLGAFPPAGWVSADQDGNGTWVRTTQTGGYQQTFNAIKYNFYGNTVAGDQDELILPYMDLGGADAPEMAFDYSYAQRNNSDDQLDVMVSDNCGSTWTTVWSKQGSALATAAAQTNSFLPLSIDEWQTAQVSLTGFNKSGVLVKFVTTADGAGNNLYLDNINLRQNNPTGIVSNKNNVFGVSVYPNPANNETSLSINAIRSGSAKVVIVNAIGQVVYSNTVNVHEGTNNVNVDVKNFAAGIYNVVVDNNDVTVTKKLTVTK